MIENGSLSNASEKRLSAPAILERAQLGKQRASASYRPERYELKSIPEAGEIPRSITRQPGIDSVDTGLHWESDNPAPSPRRFRYSASLRPCSHVGDRRRVSGVSNSSRKSRLWQSSKRLSRPLSFNGSVWLKNPDDIVLQFEWQDAAAAENFDPPNHSWSRAKKKRLIYLVSLAAMFSPLSSNIYFPALNAIATALNTQVAMVSLSITIYMLFQGFAPNLWGPLADACGRRPIMLMTLVVYLLANIGLSLPGDFAILMVFRGIQAVGSASTIAIGAGVIGDIAQADERGGFMGLFGGIRMFGQAIGPVFGGALSQYLGFRAIFYFLAGLSAVVLVLLALLLPETQRKIAGDGTKRLYGIYRPWIGGSKGEEVPKLMRYKPTKISFTTLFESFRLLAEKDVAVSLIFGGIIYAVWSMITSSTASLFKEEYNLNEVLIGLAFLPNGLGCILGSLITGKLMDRDYRRAAEAFREKHGLSADTELKQQDFPEFPIEKARLKSVCVLTMVFAIATGVYGFAVEWIIIVPLCLQFITAFTATAIFNANSTLMIDLYPSKPSSATAINNLVRCTLGGIGVGFVEHSISAIDEAYTFLILAGLSMLSMILVFVEQKYGPGWRMERLTRQTQMKT